MKDLTVVGRNPVMVVRGKNEMKGLAHSTEDLPPPRYLWVLVFCIFVTFMCFRSSNVQIRQNDPSDDKMQLFTMVSFIKRKKAFQTCSV